MHNRFCLAELERQPERSVSLERQQQAEPEPELLRQQVERELPVSRCQKVTLFSPALRGSLL